jgi:uncharacterized membrane protein YeaQ/YmgE (transglycosylase-associated protein family)
MELLWIILLTLVLGFVAGLIARALVPGKDAMGILPTAVLGIVGSFVGGAIWALFKKDVALWPPQAGGIILSIVGAIIVLLIYNRVVAKKA